jgi:hypothetical protein
MSLEEALVTFINEAKLAADQDSKLYALNQVQQTRWKLMLVCLEMCLHALQLTICVMGFVHASRSESLCCIEALRCGIEACRSLPSSRSV